MMRKRYGNWPASVVVGLMLVLVATGCAPPENLDSRPEIDEANVWSVKRFTSALLMAPPEAAQQLRLQSAWCMWRLGRSDEIWFHHAGAPLELKLSRDGIHYESHRLGIDVARGERPQVIVPAGCWQSAHVLGAWSLAGCAVSPGFQFSDFELAGPEFQPAPAV